MVVQPTTLRGICLELVTMYDLEKSEKRCSTLFMGRSESEVYTIPFKSFRRIHALRCVSSQLQISNSGQTFASGGDQKVDTSLMLNAASGRWLLAIGSGRASPRLSGSAG